MFGIARARAFRLLRGRRYVNVVQPDSRGDVRVLVDEKTSEPYCINARKVRRALAGKQKQMLCVSRNVHCDNAFFVRAQELVALDPLDGSYVILTPMVTVLGSKHGGRIAQ